MRGPQNKGKPRSVVPSTAALSPGTSTEALCAGSLGPSTLPARGRGAGQVGVLWPSPGPPKVDAGGEWAPKYIHTEQQWGAAGLPRGWLGGAGALAE